MRGKFFFGEGEGADEKRLGEEMLVDSVPAVFCEHTRLVLSSYCAIERFGTAVVQLQLCGIKVLFMCEGMIRRAPSEIFPPPLETID